MEPHPTKRGEGARGSTGAAAEKPGGACDRWILRTDGLDIPLALDSAPPAGFNSRCIILAHGAGSHMDHPSTLATSAALVSAGASVIRFNFPYRAAGRGRPDRMPVLQSCYTAVVESVRVRVHPASLIIGGRSMGGRAASMLAADGFDCDGLLLLAYPLHPAGSPERLRSDHLAHLNVPTLCINGTRDKLCYRDLMDPIVADLPPGFQMHWIDGADHSFNVLNRSGRTQVDVFDEITAVVKARLAALL